MASNVVRVLCDKLPKHTNFELVLAMIQLSIKDGKFLPGRSADDLYGPKPLISDVYVGGTYESLGGRLRRIDRTSYAVKRD
jgi:hypothetical protein